MQSPRLADSYARVMRKGTLVRVSPPPSTLPAAVVYFSLLPKPVTLSRRCALAFCPRRFPEWRKMWLKFYDREPGCIVRATATSISTLGRKLELPTAVLSDPIFLFFPLLFFLKRCSKNTPDDLFRPLARHTSRPPYSICYPSAS